MKPLRFLPILFIFILFIGCDDEKTEIQNGDETIQISLKNTEIYNHDFGLIGKEDGGSVQIEPQQSIASELGRNNENHLIYTY